MIDLSPLVFLIVGALITLQITWGYERNKKEKEEKEQYLRIILFVKEEMDQNYMTILTLDKFVNEDLKAHGEDKSLTPPLLSPTLVCWQYMIHQDNHRFLCSPFCFTIHKVYRNFQVIRDIIDSRELFRHSSRILINYHEILKVYDNEIINQIEYIKPFLEGLIKNLHEELSVLTNNKREKKGKQSEAQILQNPKVGMGEKDGPNNK